MEGGEIRQSWGAAVGKTAAEQSKKGHQILLESRFQRLSRNLFPKKAPQSRISENYN